MPTFHPDLRAGRFIPPLSYGPRLAKLQQRATIPATTPPADVIVEELKVPGGALKIFRPAKQVGTVPALLWCHGGGYIGGAAEQDDATNIRFVQELGIVVAAVRYRLAPEHPSPAATDDGYAGLLGLVDNADRLGIDLDRLAIGGASAGGGLAAGLVLLAHDRGVVPVAFQLLVYPMLDDRTVVRPDVESLTVRVWTAKSNKFGWESYLGHEAGARDASVYAAPARRADLGGLPPAWIGVGTLDLFHDEDAEYARRLWEAGVACEFVEVPGAFHGFDALFTKAPVSRQFWQWQADALRGGLGIRLTAAVGLPLSERQRLTAPPRFGEREGMTDESRNQLTAGILFASTAIVAAIVVGSMLVSGWRAGSLDNRIEWVFWAGAILGAAGIGLFGVAAVSRSSLRLLRAGMALFLVAPVLCVVAVMGDYWI